MIDDNRFAGVRILIADDDNHLRQMLTAFLTELGATVDAVADGAAAFRAASMCEPDLILMDLNMPGVNGLEAIRSLRMTYSEKPIIVLTGYSSHENLRAAEEAGATLCLGKPVDLMDLKEIILNAVGTDGSA